MALSFDRKYVFLFQLGSLLCHGRVEIYLVDQATAVEFSTLRKLVSLLLVNALPRGLTGVRVCARQDHRIRISVHEWSLLGCARPRSTFNLNFSSRRHLGVPLDFPRLRGRRVVAFRPEQLGLLRRGLAHLLDFVGQVAVRVLIRLSFRLVSALVLDGELLARGLFVEKRAFQWQLG